MTRWSPSNTPWLLEECLYGQSSNAMAHVLCSLLLLRADRHLKSA